MKDQGQTLACDVSVVIPVAPGADPGPAMEAVRGSIPAGVTAEILTVDGTHPSRQRNLAAHMARGRVLWFLDHDSIAGPRTLGRLLEGMRSAAAGVAGGPNLAAEPQSATEAVLGGVIGSPLGSPLVSARYGGRTTTGQAGERALILCNLAVDREAFIGAGGFDPRLYPNEENALLNRLARRGVGAVHVHDAPVRKPRPGSWRAFAVEAFRYGRGRMQQIWVAPAPGDAVFVAAFVAAAAFAWAMPAHPWIAAVYLLGVFAESVRIVLSAEGWDSHGKPWMREGAGVRSRARFAGYLAAFIIRHAAYASGMAWGIVSGWTARWIRWRPMQATVRRFAAGRRDIRRAETVSCMIGSMDKEAEGSCLR